MKRVRKPLVEEVPGIKDLIDIEVERRSVLPRTLDELYEAVRDFFVYVDEKGVGGCCALHIDTPDLAEIRSLVVRDDLRGQRVGERLVIACYEEAQNLGLARLYALTRSPVFFEKLLFRQVDKDELPQKVYKDCLRCHLYPQCDEIAMVRDLRAYQATSYVPGLPGGNLDRIRGARNRPAR
jgi:amino-acid N-acetyltransferase